MQYRLGSIVPSVGLQLNKKCQMAARSKETYLEMVISIIRRGRHITAVHE